jgi:hypothetical protein
MMYPVTATLVEMTDGGVRLVFAAPWRFTRIDLDTELPRYRRGACLPQD